MKKLYSLDVICSISLHCLPYVKSHGITTQYSGGGGGGGRSSIFNKQQKSVDFVT